MRKLYVPAVTLALSLVGLCTILAPAFLSSPPVQARPLGKKVFKKLYGLDGSGIDNCSSCHFKGFSFFLRDNYGIEFYRGRIKNAAIADQVTRFQQALMDIEWCDADFDGTANIAEILAHVRPAGDIPLLEKGLRASLSGAGGTASAKFKLDRFAMAIDFSLKTKDITGATMATVREGGPTGPVVATLCAPCSDKESGTLGNSHLSAQLEPPVDPCLDDDGDGFPDYLTPDDARRHLFGLGRVQTFGERRDLYVTIDHAGGTTSGLIVPK